METAVPALDKAASELSVTDVYDIAAVVGQEFERIIDVFGCDAIAKLMPKVVRLLELLEVLVSRNQLDPEMEELRLELDRLRLERMDRIDRERKHQQELVLVEDVWRGEAQDLLTQIAKLQEENKQLAMNVSHKDVNLTEEEILKQEAGMSEKEWQVMKKLKEVVDKQRDELRAKDRELTLKNEDVEALQLQQNRLMKINHELRHKVSVIDAQGKGLIEQKVELETTLQTKEQEMGSMRMEIGKLKEKFKGQPTENGDEQLQTEHMSDEDFQSDKTLVDLNDPNRPRFTLQELRDVLHERNELKAKVFLLQEEMAYYKSEESEEENGPSNPPPTPQLQPRMAIQPESGIRRLFNLFSRDKRGDIHRQQFQGPGGVWAMAEQEGIITEQGQEALQDL
ncbi:RILP-like protein 1 isoform X1 [Scyliorhinus canicula]|uniref:RILP-like protein 1 isoform X1 n=1 Tax=Scyliorhinus canicula TaxID=7830 RepID=UPI0018F7A518|nr:RILP-like protein 1 isoform X1 [Scyliorhinus canicula]